MIRHCVLLSFKPDTNEEQIEALCTSLRGLPAVIPEIRAFNFGRDLNLGEGNAPLGITVDFDSIDDWQTYRDNAIHQKAIADFLRPIVAQRSACQFEF